MGRGAAPMRADIAIDGDRIVAVGADVGAGRIRLNSTEDADFFSKTCKFTPYALDASPLIAAFTIGESDAMDEAEE